MYNWLVSSISKKTIRIAAVISSHGFGHAARSSAILDRLRIRIPELEIELFTEVPEWFFEDSLQNGYHYNFFPSDVGLVQRTPFAEDLAETVNRVSKIFLLPNGFSADLASVFAQRDCGLVLCDISPLGIQAAKRAGIPSVLVENFTWDWIYASYIDIEPRFQEISSLLNSIFTAADYHITTEPICTPCRCDLVSGPVSRQPRNYREKTREMLGIAPDKRMVLVTSGGIEQKYPGVEALLSVQGDVHFVIPGGSSQIEQHTNLTLLPHRSDYYHPDLVQSSDAVVGKLGYSTVAEAFHAGVPYGYVPRDRFRETIPLASFIRNNMGGIEIPYSEFQSGGWVKVLPDLLAKPRQNRSVPNGAVEIAQFLSTILNKQ